ncbi:APC family permease [Flavilitoribacter nigricans]|uniref:Amino acid transporter n=1 Tax=Flavilitoribacter nigricans (strain ATCC 23147 / DSM 23189 / NBRC 102662 / NCIMB 1420 / SS-2) TaxID=1122177 RepID=A0A2D0NIX6_FLAN2|nr:APC family permease [Flavilitoribacter nigricans]PHN08149.1 amino acid transporter [Flavilitoribacter nigricans DSM 23189 = NBRC 102662]
MALTPSVSDKSSPGLSRRLGLLGLAATGICSMLGASIYVVPFMIQRSVPGIGPNVLPAFLLAALPAVLAAMAYAILSTAMPRAGGSYLYASRGLHPYWGFAASFSQWFGLSIVIGVIAYIIIPFFRDICSAMGWEVWAAWLETGIVRVGMALLLLWTFVVINILGMRFYERTLVPLMLLMFGLGAIVIVAGFSFDHADFANGLLLQEGRSIPTGSQSGSITTFLTASALLFASFIGFDSIAQAGGEARNPQRNLPLAIGLAIGIVGLYYFCFTAAVYHAVPWEFVASEAAEKDIAAPGLLGYVLSPGWTVAITLGATIALINDLPAMLLSVSRLMFAWSEDGVFPKRVARVHPRFQTPVNAILISGGMATVGILGSHFAGDFFLGIDIMVTAMLVNFLLMCLTVLRLPTYNPPLVARISLFKSRKTQLLIGLSGSALLSLFLVLHTFKDLQADVSAWYFHATYVWLLVMALGSLIFLRKITQLKRSGKSLKSAFKKLPDQ